MKYISLLVLLLFTCLGMDTRAQTPDPRALFEQATNEFQKENFKEAANLFRQAYDAKPSWKLLFNIGQAEAAASSFGEALDAFEDYLVQGGDQVPDDRRGMVEREMTRLRLLVGFVEIDAEDGLDVSINGKPKGRTPLPSPIRAAAGKNTVALMQTGRIVFEKQVSLASGLTLRVDARSEMTTTAGPTNDPEPDTASTIDDKHATDSRRLKTGGIVLIASGGALVGMGGVFLGLAGQAWNDADNAAEENENVFNEHYDDFKTRRAIAVVSLATGATLAVIGAVMIGVSKKKTPAKAAVVTWKGSGMAVAF
jgi:tetratricopeptide (TPR) repeat protein